MGISCSCNFSGNDWWWEMPADADFEPLNTKRARRCWSCGERIAVGDDSVKFLRMRAPRDEPPWIEERIYGEEVPLCNGFFCEVCGGLAMRLIELGFCFTVSRDGDEPIREQIREYMESVSEA